MTVEAIISALSLPDDARVDQRIPKKLLVENGAPTSTDKRHINDGIEDIHWLAALKPETIGVPIFRDTEHEYLEIAVLSVSLRVDAKTTRLTELIHRAIPYPIFLIQSQTGSTNLKLSLAHLRWSQGQSGKTVLDCPIITTTVATAMPLAKAFIASLNITSQPREHLKALYEGWVERFEAHIAASFTGSFSTVLDVQAAERRRNALAEYDRLTREIKTLRSRASKESQLNRRVELNLHLKQLESRLAETINFF